MHGQKVIAWVVQPGLYLHERLKGPLRQCAGNGKARQTAYDFRPWSKAKCLLLSCVCTRFPSNNHHLWLTTESGIKVKRLGTIALGTLQVSVLKYVRERRTTMGKGREGSSIMVYVPNFDRVLHK